MQIPGSARAEGPLRGDYAGAAADYTVPQHWDKYTPEMHERWRRLYTRQSRLAARYAAPQFTAGLARLDCASAIPRFEDANRVLGDATRWRLVAVPGFIPDSLFFDHLAGRRFPVTRWLREEHELDYLVEPDVFHDFFGHVPMLLDPAVAEFLVLYGHAAKRAAAAGALDLLARIYWYTIEFGLVESGNAARAFGAGILSSAGETVFSIADPAVPRLRFDPVRIMRTAYRIDSFQRCYFVLDSLEQLVEELTALDFGPIYAAWRDRAPIPAGAVLPDDRPWQVRSR